NKNAAMVSSTMITCKLTQQASAEGRYRGREVIHAVSPIRRVTWIKSDAKTSNVAVLFTTHLPLQLFESQPLGLVRRHGRICRLRASRALTSAADPQTKHLAGR